MSQAVNPLEDSKPAPLIFKLGYPLFELICTEEFEHLSIISDTCRSR